MEVLIIIGAIVVLVLLILSLIYFGLKIFLHTDKKKPDERIAFYVNKERDKTLKDVMSYLYELSGDDMTTEDAACFDYIERMFCKKFGVEKVTSNSDSEPEVTEDD